MDSIKANVEKVVNEIYARDGQVQPSILVEEARPETSPAHSAFEWDDSKAGSEYRLIQARNWIRKVEIVIEDRREKFVHVPVISTGGDENLEEREGYYKPVSAIVHNKGEFELALNEVLSRVHSAQAAYENLKKIADKSAKRINTKKAERGFGLVQSALADEGQRATL